MPLPFQLHWSTIKCELCKTAVFSVDSFISSLEQNWTFLSCSINFVWFIFYSNPHNKTIFIDSFTVIPLYVYGYFCDQIGLGSPKRGYVSFDFLSCWQMIRYRLNIEINHLERIIQGTMRKWYEVKPVVIPNLGID